MQKRRVRGWALLAGALIVGLVTATLVPGAPSVGAQGGDFEVYSDLITIGASGEQGTFEVGVRSLQSSVAAVDGTVTFDAAALTAVSCVSLVDLGACNTSSDGQMRFAAVVADGFVSAAQVPLFEITFNADGMVGDYPIDASLTAAYDADLNTVTGDIVPGSVNVGGLLGDVDCNGEIKILDAYIVAQAAVDLRTESSCEFTSPVNQYAVALADINQDGLVNIADAYGIARCTVGLDDCE